MIAENSTAIIWKTDINTQGEFKNSYISGVVDDYLRLPKGSINNNFDEFLKYVNKEQVIDLLNTILAAIEEPEKIKEIQYPVTRANGEKAWFLSSGGGYVGDGVVHLYGSTSDVTNLVQALTDLEESQRTLVSIAENFPDSYISIINADYTVGYTAGQEFKKNGLDPNDFIGLPLEQVFGEHADFVRSHYAKTFKGEESSFELSINGQYQEYRAVPLLDESGKINRILAVSKNVTERKKAEKEKEERDTNFHSLFHQTNDAIFFLDLDGYHINVKK